CLRWHRRAPADLRTPSLARGDVPGRNTLERPPDGFVGGPGNSRFEPSAPRRQPGEDSPVRRSASRIRRRSAGALRPGPRQPGSESHSDELFDQPAEQARAVSVAVAIVPAGPGALAAHPFGAVGRRRVSTAATAMVTRWPIGTLLLARRWLRAAAGAGSGLAALLAGSVGAPLLARRWLGAAPGARWVLAAPLTGPVGTPLLARRWLPAGRRSAAVLVAAGGLSARTGAAGDGVAHLVADLAVVVAPGAGARQHRLVADLGPVWDVGGDGEGGAEAAVVGGG